MPVDPHNEKALRARIALLGRKIKASKARTATLTRWRKIRMKQLTTLLGNVPANNNGWHPNAIRVPYASAGGFTPSKPKIVWHTTEGVGLPTYNGTAPHFTLDVKTGKLWQHIPITQSAKALEHRSGTVETNHAHALQVELIAISDANSAVGKANPSRCVKNLTDADYARIAALGRWLERWGGVKRSTSVTFTNQHHSMSDGNWLTYNGHCGHQHVPHNAHWDPDGLLIWKVLR